LVSYLIPRKAGVLIAPAAAAAEDIMAAVAEEEVKTEFVMPAAAAAVPAGRFLQPPALLSPATIKAATVR
jgi:hypothetical protein